MLFSNIFVTPHTMYAADINGSACSSYDRHHTIVMKLTYFIDNSASNFYREQALHLKVDLNWLRLVNAVPG
jgi:hypothetical protein